MLIDTHCHLNDEKLLPEADGIISNFGKHGIESAICVGYDMPSSEKAAELADKYENLYAAIGIHPHDATTADYDKYERLATLSSSPKVVAIGEIGLDYHYDLSPRAIQKGAFREQIELADTLGLPIVLHVREAYEDTRQILFESRRYINNGLLLHCYSGSSEFVKIFSELDAYFAFGGAITFNNAKHNLEAMKTVSLDRLLFETDCPYMTPVPFRGKTNKPEYVNLVADKAAEVLGKDRTELEKITTENAKRLFTRMK
ncbi:MAG: TatD family hydrolase [Clostridia bacterium]|nr:TatD family hydrolase [Clostridia bacterium]